MKIYYGSYRFGPPNPLLTFSYNPEARQSGKHPSVIRGTWTLEGAIVGNGPAEISSKLEQLKSAVLTPNQDLRLVTDSGSEVLAIRASEACEPPRCASLEFPEGAAGAWVTNLRYRARFEFAIRSSSAVGRKQDVRVSLRYNEAGLATVTENGRSAGKLDERSIPVLLPREPISGFSRTVSVDYDGAYSSWTVTDSEKPFETPRDVGIVSLTYNFSRKDGIITVTGSATLEWRSKLEFSNVSRIAPGTPFREDSPQVEEAKRYLRDLLRPSHWFEETFSLSGNVLSFTFRAIATDKGQLLSLSIRYTLRRPHNLKYIECVDRLAVFYRVGYPVCTCDISIVGVARTPDAVPTVASPYITSENESVEVMGSQGTAVGYRVTRNYSLVAGDEHYLDLRGIIWALVRKIP